MALLVHVVFMFLGKYLIKHMGVYYKLAYISPIYGTTHQFYTASSQFSQV